MVHARLEFKLADMWIGVFWQQRQIPPTGYPSEYRTDIWICLLPCVPLHIWWVKEA